MRTSARLSHTRFAAPRQDHFRGKPQDAGTRRRGSRPHGRFAPARSSLLVGVLALATGCPTAGDITAGGPDADVDAEAARNAFDTDVAPELSGFCSACHAVTGDIGFLAASPNVYDNVRSWPGLLDLERPNNSALLTKGVHDGPAWTADQAVKIQAWIVLEAKAGGVEPAPDIETEAFSPVVGINTVDLTPIGLTGSTITFRLEKLQVGFYLSELMLNGGAGGARVVHPLFVTWIDDVPAPDPIDRFAGLELDVAEATSQMIGGGTMVMVDVAPDAKMSIHFAVAEPAVGGGGGGGGGGGLGGGCQNVAAFTANAQPVLAQRCAGCHAGSDIQATSATDMTRIADLTPEGQAAACAQILSRVNLTDANLSGIFIAPDPQSGATHPFKFMGDVNAFQAFKNALLVWIAQE
jgi:cytochrome c553